MLRSKGLLAGIAVAVIAVAAILAFVVDWGGDDTETSTAAGPVAATEAAGSGNGAQEGGANDEGGASAEAGEGPGEAASGGATAAGSEASAGGEGSGSAGGGAAGGAGGGATGKAGLNSSTAKGGSRKKSSRKKRSAAGEDSGTATETGTDFFASADAICQEARANTRASLSDYTKPGLGNLEKHAAEIVDQLVIPSLEGVMRDIRALNPPASASAAVAALFASIEKMIAAGRADPEQFILTGELVAESEEEAKANGFTVCGGI
jgi:hypothetical protein